MNKKTAFLFTAIVLTVLLIGCSGSKKAKKPEDVKGEIFTARGISAFVPEGWKAFQGPNMFARGDNAEATTIMQICKGAENEFDLFNKPFIQINHYTPDKPFTSARSFYSDAKDIAPVTIGDRLWNGYSFESAGYLITVLETTAGDTCTQVMITVKADGEQIGLEDVEVQAIIAGITLKK